MRIVPEGTTALGLQLPVQAQSRRFAEGWEADAGPAEILQAAVAADEAGFLYVGVCDHLGVPDSHVEVMQPTWYEPLTTLAWVAQATTRVRLLTHVYVLALRHPLEGMGELLGRIAELRGERGVADLDLGAMAMPVHVGEPDWDTGRWTTVGSPDQVAEHLRAYAELGVSHVQVRPRSRSIGEYIEQVHRLGTEVAPLL